MQNLLLLFSSAEDLFCIFGKYINKVYNIFIIGVSALYFLSPIEVFYGKIVLHSIFKLLEIEILNATSTLRLKQRHLKSFVYLETEFRKLIQIVRTFQCSSRITKQKITTNK